MRGRPRSCSGGCWHGWPAGAPARAAAATPPRARLTPGAEHTARGPAIGLDRASRRPGPPSGARAAVPGHAQRSAQHIGRQPVVTAIVLIKAEIQRIPEVAEVIAQVPAVSEVYSVTGDFDLVAIVRVRAHDELADVIPGGLNKVPGVTATQTHIAFRTYSRHDLDAAFAIGLADA